VFLSNRGRTVITVHYCLPARLPPIVPGGLAKLRLVRVAVLSARGRLPLPIEPLTALDVQSNFVDQYIDVAESIVATRSPFCGYNTTKCVELNGEDLSCYLNKNESVSLRKCPYDR